MDPLYTLKVTGTLTNNDDSKVSCSVIIPLEISCQNLGPPLFSSELKDFNVTAGDSKSFSLPSFTDPDSEDTPYIKSVDLGKASAFVKFNYPSVEVSPSLKSAGTYPITITLADNNPNILTMVYTFNIIVSEKVANSTNTTSNSTSNNNSTSDNSSNTNIG